MKKLLIGFVAGVVITAIAYNAEASADYTQNCITASKTMHKVMEARQNGTGLATVLQQPGAEVPFIQELIIAAYRVPIYNHPANQAKAADEFSNQVLLMCLQGQ